MNEPAVSTPSVRSILCVLSEEQAQIWEPDLEQLRGPNINLWVESSPEEALSQVGDFDPPLVIAGMDLGAMEGLEFLATLMQRYPKFCNKVVVLPDKGDPFPPVLQYRDPVTGRSVTENVDWSRIVDLARSISTQANVAEPLTVPSTPARPSAPRTAPAPARPAVSEPAVAVPSVAAGADEVVARGPESLPVAESPSRSRTKLLWVGALALGVVGAALWVRSMSGAPPSAEPVAAATPQPTQPTPPAPQPAAEAAQPAAPADPGPQAAAEPAPAPAAPTAAAEPERAPAPEVGPDLAQDTTLPLRFPVGHATYSVADADQLKRLIATYKTALERSPHATIEVGGHTSHDGPANLNEVLGRRRASEARDLLIWRGLPPKRLFVKSYGDSKPLPEQDAELAAEQLRRVTLRLVP